MRDRPDVDDGPTAWVLVALAVVVLLPFVAYVLLGQLQERPVLWERATVGEGGTTLVIEVTHGASFAPLVEVTETAADVDVTITQRPTGIHRFFGGGDMAALVTLVVELDAPIGDRTVTGCEPPGPCVPKA